MVFISREIRYEKNTNYEFAKQLTKSYFYIDYKQMVDVIKYKIYKMRKSFEVLMRKVKQVVGLLMHVSCNTGWSASWLYLYHLLPYLFCLGGSKHVKFKHFYVPL